jgi:energy-coupling factor transporter ATP-binding protein EcfA2
MFEEESAPDRERRDAMHVARLRIDGVRGFYGARSVDLDLTRPDGSLAGWTVLAGRNGSGKSTLLQALALALSGPRSTGFIPSLSDWISSGATRADIKAELTTSEADTLNQLPFDLQVWMNFSRSLQTSAHGTEIPEPEFHGVGLDSFAESQQVSAVRPRLSGWFYAGYGPFRHLGSSTARRSGKSGFSKLAQQVSSLFDETVPLADAVDWLIDQHLYQLEKRSGAGRLLNVVTTLLSDGLLPDGFKVRKVDSDGLWLSNAVSEFP